MRVGITVYKDCNCAIMDPAHSFSLLKPCQCISFPAVSLCILLRGVLVAEHLRYFSKERE